mmetsp:Transcript_1217/g.3012  ORF Transcript_1217/g.3012 Transcript_1217/m.3012 type:complete len:1796 (+) Transcript_1217:3534-8921(+)
MEDLVQKITHPLPEVSDRAVNNLHTKLLTRIVDIRTLLTADQSLCGRLLHWINERQTEAEVATVAASLKILLLCAQEADGNSALIKCSAKEFLAGFSRFAPPSVKHLVEDIIRLLVSPLVEKTAVKVEKVAAEEQYYTKFEPRQILQPTPVRAVSLPVEETISILEEVCEFPPVFLCEADEKRLFELGVSIKFGDPEVVKEACEDLESNILKDYPLEALLQRTDILRALVGVSSKAADVKALSVAKSALRVLTSFVKKLENYWKSTSAPEFHPSSANIARPVHAEHISISLPSLKVADWQAGTPGVTLSVSGAVEWALNAASLADKDLFYESKSLIEASLWVIERLLKYPFVITKLFDKLTHALATHANTELSSSCCEISIKCLQQIPMDSVKNVLTPESKFLALLAEQVVFQKQECSVLETYLTELTPSVLDDLEKAKACERGREALEELSEKLGSLDSISAYYVSLDLCALALTAVEFIEPSTLVSAVIELCCYSQVVSEDSSFESHFERTESWLTGLLYCPVKAISKLIPTALVKALESNASMGGFAKGALRAAMLTKVLSRPNVLQQLIVHEERQRLVITLADRVDNLNSFMPWLELVQCYPELDALRRSLSQLNKDEDSAVVRTLRGLFSKDSAVRRNAAKVVCGSKSAADLAVRRYAAYEDVAIDPANLIEKGDIDNTPIPQAVTFSNSDVQRLVDILKSRSIESTLKLTALEQILIILLFGARDFKEELQGLFEISIGLTKVEEDTVVARKLLAKALQVATVLVYNYKEWTRAFYTCSLDFIVKLAALAFHDYPPVRHYSLTLVYTRVFSLDCKENSLLTAFTLLPDGSLGEVCDPSTRLEPVGVAEPFSHGFLIAFPTESYRLQPDMKLWEGVPSAQRVKDYVENSSSKQVTAATVLGNLHSEVTNAETHEALIEAIDRWANLIGHSQHRRALLTDSSFSSAILQVLRIPPTNLVEERLWTGMLESLSRCVVKAEPTDAFLNSLCIVFTRSVLPFVAETTCSGALMKSVLRLLNILIPLHGPVKVFTEKYLNSAVGTSSLLHFLKQQSDLNEDPAILRELIEALDKATNYLAVQLDLEASPSAQTLQGEAVASILTRVQALTSAGSFEHKDLQRKLLILLSDITLEWESYIWAIRWAEDRDARVRLAAWFVLSSTGLTALNIHSTLLEQAFEVLLTPTECYGVKTQALAFLNSIAHSVTIGETVPEVFGELYKRGIMSQLKIVLTELTATPPHYFAVCVSLLENLACFDPSKVKTLCSQLGVWECLVSLLRPGALQERLANDKRRFKGMHIWTEEDVLPAVHSIASFLSAVCQGDDQLSSELVETTHLLTHAVVWLKKSAHASMVNLLHVCVFNCPPASMRVLESIWAYEILADALDIEHSNNFRLACARLISSLLPILKIGDAAERLCLHMMALYKDTELEPLLAKDVAFALASLLKHSWSAKRVALSTGFANELVKKGKAAASTLQFEDIRKKSSDTKELQLILLTLKVWTQGDPQVKNSFAWSGTEVSPIFKWLLSLWQVVQRHEVLVKEWLETLSCLVSGAQEAKKACVVLLEGRQSLMSTLVEFASRPSSVPDDIYRLALTVLGNLAAAKEARQLLTKCKFPQGLTQRLTTAWQQHKDPLTMPAKTAETLEFLSTLSFYRQGQAAIVSVRGALEVVFELFKKYIEQGTGLKVLNYAVLLLRNLCYFSNDKAHLLANSQALPLVLALVSSSSQKLQLRRLAVATVWAMLYHNQHVKGMLKNPQVLELLQRQAEETEREKERNPNPHLNDIVVSLQAVLRIVLS